MEETSSSALEACNPSSDDFVIVSSYSNEEQVIPDDDMIHTRQGGAQYGAFM